MRVLAVAENLDPIGGLERLQLDLAHGLAERGHRLDLAYLRPGSLLRDWAAITDVQVHVPAVRLGGSPRVRTAARFAQAVVRCASLSYDVVYVHHYRQLQLGWVLARRRRVPLVWHCHSMAPRNLGPVGHRLLRTAECVVQVSESNAELWQTLGVPERSTVVLHNGVDQTRFRPPTAEEHRDACRMFNIAPETDVVTFLGGSSPNKGGDVLLNAWGEIESTRGARTLLLAGAANEEMRRAAAASTESASIRVVGHLSDPIAALQCADVVVVPSTDHDPCPLAVLEGMACGRPVVASRVGGIPELLGTDFDDLLVAPRDTASLARMLGCLIENPDARRHLGMGLRERATSDFTLDRLVDGVEAVLQRQVDT